MYRHDIALDRKESVCIEKFFYTARDKEFLLYKTSFSLDSFSLSFSQPQTRVKILVKV